MLLKTNTYKHLKNFLFVKSQKVIEMPPQKDAKNYNNKRNWQKRETNAVFAVFKILFSRRNLQSTLFQNPGGGALWAI